MARREHHEHWARNQFADSIYEVDSRHATQPHLNRCILKTVIIEKWVRTFNLFRYFRLWKQLRIESIHFWELGMFYFESWSHWTEGRSVQNFGAVCLGEEQGQWVSKRNFCLWKAKKTKSKSGRKCDKSEEVNWQPTLNRVKCDHTIVFWLLKWSLLKRRKKMLFIYLLI